MARMMLESGDTESLRAGIRFLAQISLIEDRKDDRQSFEDDGVRTLAWQLVQRTATDPGFNEGWDWAQVVSTLAVSECGRAAEIVAPLVIGGGNSMRHQVEELLKELATRSPRTALNAIGKSLLDPATMPYSQIAVFRDLLSPIPANEIIDWLKQNGVVGARALARHLPQPVVDDTGRLVVPEVVEYLFTEFEADDDLFRNFCSGCHSGEIWRGNGAERFQAEAEEAKKFMTHPIRRIREWARVECEKREALARMQQREHEEEVVEF